MKVNVLIPLCNFNWDGGQFQLERFGKIIKCLPDLSKFESSLSKSEIEDYPKYLKYWLSFDQIQTDILTVNAKIEIFLLSLWIASPTKTQIKIHFESSKSVNGYDKYSAKRHLYWSQWNPGYTRDQIDNNILKKVNEYIDSITDIYLARKRLYIGLLLNLSGIFSISWQVAFICFSAAMEAILTYSKHLGLTDRLAKSFACLTESDNSNKDLAYKRFSELYKIRSDIMHGRAMNYDDENFNLKNLNDFEILLRKVWQTILACKHIIVELEKSDTERKNFFAVIENRYKPPKISPRSGNMPPTSCATP